MYLSSNKFILLQPILRENRNEPQQAGRASRARNLYRTSLSSISEESLAIQKRIANDIEKSRIANEESAKNSATIMMQQNQTNLLLKELILITRRSNNLN